MAKVGALRRLGGRASAEAKAARCGIRFNGRSRIAELGAVEIEDNVLIGDNAHISRNLVLYTFSHQYEGGALPYDETFRHRPVVIGRNAWIGMNVEVLPGATFGDGTINGKPLKGR